MNHARSIALYRRVSSLYPKAFRAEYGDDLVATLYHLGAPLVLPAGLTGCLPQSG